jgi:hypothetical protein
MAFISILQNFQLLSEECDKQPIIKRDNNNNNNNNRQQSPSVNKSVKEFFDLVNRVEKELNLAATKLPISITGVVNASEKKAIHILTGKSKSKLYNGPIFSPDNIYQPHGVVYNYKGKTRTYNPDFQIGNLIIEVKCCTIFKTNFNEIKAKQEAISKTHPFQLWMFDKDQGDLIDIITFIDKIPYHINGYQFSTFDQIETPIKWREWICETPFLEKSKVLVDFFQQHTKL